MNVSDTMKITSTLLLALLITVASKTGAQVIAVKPQWEKPVKVVQGNEKGGLAPSFVNAQYPGLRNGNILPAWSERIKLPEGTSLVDLSIDSLSYIPLSPEEKELLSTAEIPVTPGAEVSVMKEGGKPYAVISLTPFGIDPSTGEQAKLDYFRLKLLPTDSTSEDSLNMNTYRKHSRMAVGDWYKMWVRETGVYRITYEDMQGMGINLNGLNPDRIAVFGRGGEKLNEEAGSSKYDDVTEVSIKVVTSEPGKFQPGDYILFYGEGPIIWRQNKLTGYMRYYNNPYTTASGYFLAIDNVPGKRMPVAGQTTNAPNTTSNSYTALGVYGNEIFNVLKSGRKWFSDKFDNYTRSFLVPEFNFPDIIPDSQAELGYGLAAKTTQKLSFSLLVNEKLVAESDIDASLGDNSFGKDLSTAKGFKAPANSTLKVKVVFNLPNSSAIGWLDYVTLNVRSTLRFHGPQMSFRDPLSVGENKITAFTLESSQSGLELWDVTDHSYPHIVPMSHSGNVYNFTVKTSRLKEFVVFDGSSFLKPEFEGKVANQDLHALGNFDMIIVTHPSFRKQAERLAGLHNSTGEITAKVVSLPQIYNEFSSGHQDITAIRDFMKMLYDRGHESGYPKYLLLFGNASYDYKDILINNSNLVPTFESENSVHPTASFVTDDYFGLLDDGEGKDPDLVTGLLDVGVGRLPVRTYQQAEDVVSKIEAYLTNKEETFGDWRNNVLVIGDDEDGNLHLNQAERLCTIIKDNYPLYNVNKIYFDAYRQYNTPGGGRYPDVNREITSMIDKGVLLTNYIGHGGELGWADERVLEIVDINAWKNFGRMGLFFTATCEFSRFDDPQHTSAGELVFLNPEGGALSMITTTRLAFSSTNENLNNSFMDTVLKKNGSIPRLGDVIKYTKNDNKVSPNGRQLTLFGDPALPVSIPKYNVVTTSIIDPATLTPLDTLSANAVVTVNGEVQDFNGETMTGFNGEVSVKVFDKWATVRTLGQDIESNVAEFEVQKSVIYNGQAKVQNGLFSITFPIPKDIDYNIGKGKISYYASNGSTDAHGYYDNILIGGSKKNDEADETGPQITLFMNDTSFVDGGLTSENPRLVVKLFDESGINTVGNGVGHDLVAVLDGDNYNSVLLNDYYVADLDSYKSGWTKYQYFNLEDGEHTINVKAWDVYNNSSEASISFVVKHDIRLDIDDVTAYPNPSGDKVWFRFKHNLFDAILNIEIEIYNSTGTLVRIINPGKVTADGYIVEDIVWDGLSNDGSVLRNGLYVCRVKVLDRNGNSSAHSVKVVMAK